MAYTINEIFYSVQGEGMNAGRAATFVRFTGCNMTCRVESHGFDCDTEFTSGRKMTSAEIVAEIKRISGNAELVILTGGEPGLQVDRQIVEALHDDGRVVAVETNGSIDLSGIGIDWISCSPKVAEHAMRLKFAHELRYVRAHGQGIPRPSCKADYYLVSPAADGAGIVTENAHWCVRLVKENPQWRLSLQTHKLLTIR